MRSARLLCLILGAVAAVPAGGCDGRSGTRLIARLEAARRRADPPVLWSIQVEGEKNAGRPILICADQRIASGFSSIVPAQGGKDCKRDGDVTATRNGLHFRCRVNGSLYAVSSGVVGDRARDFAVTSSAYPVLDEGPEYARTLRFRRRGACPPGWRVGEATNQAGVRTLAIEP